MSGGGSTTANGRWGCSKTEIKRVDPRTLKRREVNARYMSPEEFKRLVENVRLDGGLTSAVLTCSLPDGGLEILSGHHRTAAAVEAGIATIEVINISTLLTEERKKAIQLSHNAINGKDNQSILAELYSDLSLDAKIFSGLTDEILNLDKLDIAGLGEAISKLRRSASPSCPRIARGRNTLNKIKANKQIVATHVARYRDFNAVFDAIIAVKEKRGVVNSALALTVMAELAIERLQQLDSQVDQQDANGGGGGLMYLIITFCLISNPAVCEDSRVRLLREVTPMQCIFKAQEHIASIAHQWVDYAVGRYQADHPSTGVTTIRSFVSSHTHAHTPRTCPSLSRIGGSHPLRVPGRPACRG